MTTPPTATSTSGSPTSSTPGAAPGTASPGHPLEDCTGALSVDWTDYDTVPLHLFGFVTQTVRGELALIDVTGNAVYDTDPSTPGYNFQPIGAQPIDVAVTPGGAAVFVTVDEPTRPGIYAMPTAWIRERVPDLTSWPACSLPGTPGAMTILVDPPQDPANPASARATCDGAYGQPPTEDRAGLALSLETRTPGTRKILVAVPDQGEIDVVDAQDLLSREPGTLLKPPKKPNSLLN